MSKNKINLDNFDDSKLSEKIVKTNALGGKSVAIHYSFEKESDIFTIQTPRMLTFGLDKYTFTEGTPTYSMTFSFINLENDEKIRNFYSFLEKLDKWGREVAKKNSWEWFGMKTISDEEIQKNYFNNIKIPTDKDGKPNGKPHFCKLKLRKSGTGFTTKFFNKDKETIENENIESMCNRGSFCRALLECNGFWINENRLGISWKVKEMIVEPRITNDIGKEYAFTD